MIHRIRIDMGNVHSQMFGSQKVINYIRNQLKTENDIYMWRQREWLRWHYFIDKKGRFMSGLIWEVMRCIRRQDKFQVELTFEDKRDYDGYDLSPKYISQRMSEEDVEIFSKRMEEGVDMYEDSLLFIERDRIKNSVDDSGKRSKEFNSVIDRIQTEITNKRILQLPYVPRPYQREALDIAIRRTRGVFEHAPGAGKTFLIAAIIGCIDVYPAVIVCGKRDLAKQLQREISEYTGKEVGIIGDSRREIRDITVVMVQSAGSRASQEVKDLLSKVKYVAVDECHHVQAETWRNLLKAMPNAMYRHGFTATNMTSKIRDSKGTRQASRLLLEQSIGPVLHRASLRFLAELGWLATPTVYRVPFDLATTFEDVEAAIVFGEEYEERIVKNPERNELVAALVKYEMDIDPTQNFVIFVKMVAHGLLIKDEIHRATSLKDEDVVFLFGDVKDTRRQAEFSKYVEGDTQVLIGTSIIGEGLNLFCSVGIQAASGLSDVDAVQRLGRVLRIRKKGGAKDIDPTETNVVKYYDIADYGHPYFTKHSRSRMESYEGEDFPAIDFNMFNAVQAKEEIEEQPYIAKGFSSFTSDDDF